MRLFFEEQRNDLVMQIFSKIVLMIYFYYVERERKLSLSSERFIRLRFIIKGKTIFFIFLFFGMFVCGGI